MANKWLLVALVGCVPGNDVTGNGSFTATWSFLNVDGSPAGCQPGFDTMVISTAVVGDGIGDGELQQAAFPCADGQGTMTEPGGQDFASTYSVEWDETDSTQGTTFLTDMRSQIPEHDPVIVDVSMANATVHADIYPAGGWAWLEWELFGDLSQQNLDTCQLGGIDKVQIVLTDTTSGASKTLMASCTDVASPGLDFPHGIGSILVPMPAGEYTYAATAFAQGQVVAQVDGGSSDVLVQAPNKIDFTPALITFDVANR